MRALQSFVGKASGTRTAALLLGISLAFAASAGSARADKVGVAAAVEPDAFSSLSGTPNKQLNIGKSIFYNERINTTASGLVQVLLVDGSTFTVGPNSNLVIDKFVYDPNKKSGTLVATFSKGTMRFIGGKLSKNEGGVKVNTPAGALAIRGGMFQGHVSGGHGTFSFLYGVSLTYSNHGQTQTVYEPGYTLDTSSGTPTIRPTTPEDIQFVQSALSGPGTTVVGGSSTPPVNNNIPLTDTVSLQDLISDANQTQVQDNLQRDETPTTPTGTPTTPTGTPTTPAPTPVPITFRVLGSPGAYTAFPGTSEYTTNDAGVLGGGNHGDNPGPGPFTDDFTWTFSIVNGRFTGTVSGLLDANCTNKDCTTIETHTISPAKVDFPASFPAATCLNGICPVTNGKITQNGVTQNYAGIAVLKQDFFAYQVLAGHYVPNIGLVADDSENPDPLLLIGGTRHQFDAPSGKLFTFQLTQDITQPDAFGPFASSDSTPNGGTGAISPLLLLEQDNGGQEDSSHAVWLQTSFLVGDKDSPSFGESFVNIALGEWSPDSGMTGARRGGSDLNTNNYSFSGDIASLAGPDGGHFLGSGDPNVVVGFDSTGTHNIGRDTPLNPDGTSVEQQSGSTYHVGVGTGTIEPRQQTSGTFKGYAAGFMQQAGAEGAPATLMSTSPGDVKLSLDATTNTMTASINVGNVDSYGEHADRLSTLLNLPPEASNALFHLLGAQPTLRENLEFGGSADNSAFIDNAIFAAFEKPGASTIDETVQVTHTETVQVPHSEFVWVTHTKTSWGHTYTYRALELQTTWTTETHTYQTPETQTYHPDDIQSYFVSADAINANAVLFPGQTVEGPNGLEQKRAFCQNCSFIKWGAWGTRTSYTNYNEQQVNADTHLGWWIAGDVVSGSDMPLTGTASYAGDAIGTVASKQNGSWNQYVATGDMNMDWNFAARGGTLSISHFDGKSFSGPMFAPGRANFSGPLGNLNTGIIGSASGSFVGSPGHGLTPAGVIGNFGVGNIQNTWKANGIFGGTQIPR